MKCWLAAQRGCLVLRSFLSFFTIDWFIPAKQVVFHCSINSRKKRKKFTLSLVACFLVFVLFFERSCAAAAAHNPPKKREDKASRAHSLLHSQSNFQFSCSLRARSPTSLHCSFHKKINLFIPFSIRLGRPLPVNSFFISSFSSLGRAEKKRNKESWMGGRVKSHLIS